MASPRWIGNAVAVADVWTATMGGTVEVGDLFTVTMGGRTFSYAATSTTIATVMPLFATAYNALDATTYPEHRQFTATSTSTTLILTEQTKGRPHTVTVATTESDGGAADTQTFSVSNTTAATGPNHWDNASNWDTGSIPADTDDVYIENSNVDILYGLSQGSIELTSLNIAQSYTGKIGLRRYNSSGYHEYRTRHLTIDATTINIGYGDGSGSKRINLSIPDLVTTVNVSGTGTSDEPGIPALQILTTHADCALTITQGSFGSAIFATEAATWKTVKIGNEGNAATDVTAWFGLGCTLDGAGSTFVQNGGVVTVDTTVLTLTRDGGTMTLTNAAAATTIDNRGGQLFDESTGTFTTLENTAYYERRSLKAKTITTARCYGEKFSLLDPDGVVTFTNPVEFYKTRVNKGSTDFGPHKKLTVAAI